MHRLVFLAPLLMIVATAAPLNEASDEPPKGINEYNFRPLILDARGIIHVGEDGVARSYSSDGQVIDYHCLNNTQLLEYAASFTNPSTSQALHEIWLNADGHNVPEEQRWTPPANLKPEFGSSKGGLTPNELQLAKDDLLGKRGTPRCYQMLCYDTPSCRVAGCYACIQTAAQQRERRCVLRPYWYPKHPPLVRPSWWKRKTRRSSGKDYA